MAKEDKSTEAKATAANKDIQTAKQEAAENEGLVDRKLVDTTLPLAAESDLKGLDLEKGSRLNEQGPAEGEEKISAPMKAYGPTDPASADAHVQPVFEARPPRQGLKYEREEKLVATAVERVVGPRILPEVEGALVEALEPSFANNRMYATGEKFRYTGSVGANLLIVEE